MGITIGHFILPLILIFLSYSIGYVLIQNRVPNHFFKLKSFFSFIIGLITLVFITSLFITKGITVHITFLVPIAFFIVKYKKKSLTTNEPFKIYDFLKGFKQIFILYLIWSFIYILIVYFNHSQQDLVRYLYWDNYHYARMTDIIWTTGQENYLVNINYNPLFEGGTTPYHYFELYINMILSKIISVNFLWSYMISLPIVLLTLASSLLLSILNNIKTKSNWKNYIYAVILLFISGIVVIPLKHVHEYYFSTNIVNNITPKFMLIYISFVLSSYLILKKKYQLSLYPLMFLQVASFVMLPIVSFIVFIGGSLLLVFKLIPKKVFFKILIVQITTAASIFMFYKFTQIPKTYNLLEISYESIIDGLFTNYVNIIKYIIATNIYLLLCYLVYLIPLSILIYIQFKKRIILKNFNVLLFIFIFIEGGILITSLLNEHHPESFQPNYFSMILGSNILLFWLFVLTLTNKIKNTKLLLYIIIIVCSTNLTNTVVNNYSVNSDKLNSKRSLTTEFLNKFSKVINKKDRYTFGFIGFTANELPLQYTKPATWPIGNTLLHYNPNINLESIDERVISTNHKNLLNTNYSIFSKNIEDNNQDNILKQFLLENNIKYFIGIEKDKIGTYLLNNSVEIIIDKHSGLFLRKIKQNNKILSLTDIYNNINQNLKHNLN